LGLDLKVLAKTHNDKANEMNDIEQFLERTSIDELYK